MRTGTALSAAGHAGVIALALFGLPWFSTREEPPVQVTDVSFVTPEAFDAAQSAAEEAERIPDAPRRRPAAQAEVLPEPTPPPLPETAAEPEPAPAPEPQPAPAEVATLAPQFNPEAPFAAPSSEAVSLTPPPATPLPAAPPRPRPVERIIAEAPMIEPEAQPEPQPEPEPAPVAPVPPAPTGALAPVAPPRPRPAALDRPQPQPQRVAAAEPEAQPEPEEQTEPKPAAKPQPKPAEKPVEPKPAEPKPAPTLKPSPAQPKPAAAPRPAEPKPAQTTPKPAGTPATQPTRPTTTAATPAAPAQGGAASTSLPVGPPLTAEEKDGLALAVKSCWSMPAGLRDLTDLKITVAAELQPDGSVIPSSIRMIEPASPPDGRYQMAFRAASTALRRCSPYKMPANKYAQWRNLELVFNPEGMVSW